MSFSFDKKRKKKKKIEEEKTMEQETKINDCKLQANKSKYNNHFTNKSKSDFQVSFFCFIGLNIDVHI